MVDFRDLIEAISGDEFEERPVDIEEFVTSPEYLNMPNQPLSPLQYEMVRASTQIYKHSTLMMLYGEVEGTNRYKATVNEVIAQIGKGGGKDHTSAIACAYVVYLLLCLKEPAQYYGSPEGEPIDILNVAINAEQAKNVFFTKFKNRIEKSPWFIGKFKPGNNSFMFDKDIRVFSAHSEREAWEGYNTFYVVLDEISGFALDVAHGSEQSKTADAVYKMYRASVTSRFPDFGKLILLSFPRFVNDYIQQRYNAVVGEKEVVHKEHTFRLDPDLPPGTEGNEFTIKWEEDHIIRYKTPRTYALRRTCWDFNPTKTADMYIRDFHDNMSEALGKFACMPPNALDAFFKDKEKVENAFRGSNGLNESDWTFRSDFLPEEGVRYYIHVDLAQKQDKCAVAMAHVQKWIRRDFGGIVTEPVPVVVVDSLRWWTPSTEKMVDFTEVREHIVALQRRGFDIHLVTFDRWNSADMIQELRYSYNLKSETLSVAKKHYTDMAMVVHEERLIGPKVDLLTDELLGLRITKQDKVDHTSKTSKDLSDAVCGAIYNAVEYTPRDLDVDVEVKTIDSFRKNEAPRYINDPNQPGPIRPPAGTHMPMELADFIKQMTVIGG